MATLAQPKLPTPQPQSTTSEDNLVQAFEELLETMTPEGRQGLIADLRANAVAHGE